MPASPEMSATWPSPAFALSQRRSSSSSSRASDQWGQSAGVQRLEPALLGADLERRKGSGRSRDSFEVLRAESGKLEQISHQLARALRDDDAVGAGNPLQSCGEIGRVTHDPSLLRLSRTQQITDDHDPGRDAHSHMQRAAFGRLQLRRGLGDRKPSPHGPFGVMLVRLRIAEIGEHPVAHVLGDEAPIARDQRRAALMIPRNDPHDLIRNWKSMN